MLIWKEVRKIVLQTVPRIFILRTRRGGGAGTGGGWEDPAEAAPPTPPPEALHLLSYMLRFCLGYWLGCFGVFFSALLLKKLKSH